jgi:hypothetical protein
MSGGYFNHQQYIIKEIANDIEEYLKLNEYEYSEQTLKEFNQAVNILNKAYIYAQRIDWLLSGDDGEESFHVILKDELTNKM